MKPTTGSVALALALALTTAQLGCDRPPPPLPPVNLAAYADTLAQFRALVHGVMASPDGFVSVVGLFWLKPGENRLGADSAFEVALPALHAPHRLGTVRLEHDSAWFTAAAGARATAGGLPVTTLRLRSDDEPNPTMLWSGSLQVSLLARDHRLALRVKDTLSPAIAAFEGHRYFPTDTAWRLPARFVKRARPDSIKIMDVLGFEAWAPWPGDVEFFVHGTRYALHAFYQPGGHPSEGLFLLFRDRTNGEESYEAMRYLDAPVPDSLGRMVLDFNAAYNPPCVYSRFATCPLPPRDNTLPIRVTAGEMKPARHGS